MPKTLIGLLAGLILGALDGFGAPALARGSGVPMIDLAGGLARGAAIGLVAGLVAARTQRFSPTLLAGVGAGIALTVLAWIASRTTAYPQFLSGIAIGGVSAVAAYRWGR